MRTGTVYIASDHRGFSLKAAFVDWLKQNGLQPVDLGPDCTDRCDAGDYAKKMAEKLRVDPAARGVLICGSGQAMAMTSNRYQHVRAALCTHSVMARLAREHNDANVLVLGADIVGQAVAEDCLKTFLSTEHLGGRYAERVQKLTELGGL